MFDFDILDLQEVGPTDLETILQLVKRLNSEQVRY